LKFYVPFFQAKIVFFDEDVDKQEDNEEEYDLGSSSGESLAGESRGQSKSEGNPDQSQTGISTLYLSSNQPNSFSNLQNVASKNSNYPIFIWLADQVQALAKYIIPMTSDLNCINRNNVAFFKSLFNLALG